MLQGATGVTPAAMRAGWDTPSPITRWHPEEVIELSTSLQSPTSRTAELSIPRRFHVRREIAPASALMSEIRSLRGRNQTYKVELGPSLSERFPAIRRPFRG
jgi:hypothetical protein